MGAQGSPDGDDRRPDVATSTSPRSNWETISLWVATGFGAGFAPWAPGTVGALWGLPLAWALAYVPLLPRVALIAVLFLIGIPVCTSAARSLGRKDPGAVVWDEIASMPLTFFLVPLSCLNSPVVWVVGFALHRVFDISKPPPVRQLEALKDGFGIMADDVAAGIYSCLALHLLIYLTVIG